MTQSICHWKICNFSLEQKQYNTLPSASCYIVLLSWSITDFSIPYGLSHGISPVPHLLNILQNNYQNDEVDKDCLVHISRGPCIIMPNQSHIASWTDFVNPVLKKKLNDVLVEPGFSWPKKFSLSHYCTESYGKVYGDHLVHKSRDSCISIPTLSPTASTALKN